LIFKWNDPLLTFTLPGGDKTLGSHADQVFTAPIDVTDKVQVRVDVKNKLLADNRQDAQKFIINLGDTLIYNDDGSVTTG
jgi:hypothetical protein